MAQRTRLSGSETQLTTEKSVVNIRTVQNSATQAHQLGRAAATFARPLVEYTDNKELVGGAPVKQATLTKLSICLHVLHLFARMKTVSLSMKAFRSLSVRAAAECASAVANGSAASSSQDEESDGEEAPRLPGPS